MLIFENRRTKMDEVSESTFGLDRLQISDPENEKEAQYFKYYFDDSSDEDDLSTEELSQETIMLTLGEFKAKNNIPDHKLDKAELSVLTHMLGRHVLATPAVNKAYYNQKSKWLANTIELPEKCFIRWVKYCIREGIIEVMRRMELPDEGEQLRKIMFPQLDVEKIIDKIANNSWKRRRSFMKATKRYSESNPNPFSVFSEIISLVETIKSYFQSCVLTPLPEFVSHDFSHYTKSVTEDSLVEDKTTSQYFQAEAKAIIEIFLSGYKYLTQKRRVRSGEAFKKYFSAKLKQIPYDPGSSLNDKCKRYIFTEIIDVRNNTPGLTFRNRMYSAGEVARFIATDMLKEESVKGPVSILDSEGRIQSDKSFETSSFRPVADKMSSFHCYTWSRFMNDALSSTEHIFDQIKTELATFPRKHISCDLNRKSGSITFNKYGDIPPQNFLVEFLAYLRVCNKSSKRIIRNRNEIPIPLITSVHFYHSIRFSCSEYRVVEVEEIKPNNGRVSKIPSSGNYSAVWWKIDMILKELNGLKITGILDDSNIAEWVLTVLYGNDILICTKFLTKEMEESKSKLKFYEPILKEIIADLTYLLFGLEVKRNPAAIVHNLMMLDLIRRKVLTWRQCLAVSSELDENSEVKAKIQGNLLEKPYHELDRKMRGGYMPMSFKRATSAARALHITYNPFISEKYMYFKYEGTALEICDKRVKELLNRERMITTLWLDKVAKSTAKSTMEFKIQKIQLFLQETLKGLNLFFAPE